MLLRGSEIVLESLLEQGVTHVFGYPGKAILDLYDALFQYQNRITHVLCTHEQHACHAADGFARASGKPGVVFATSGPGATNLVTGLACAYMDSIPLVAITCNIPKHLLGTDGFQEVDIFGITMPITKYNCIVKDVHDLHETIASAFAIAISGRPGPVLIDIPSDITTASCEFLPFEKKQAPLPPPDADGLLGAAALINESNAPLLWAGGGVLSANAGQELLALAEKLQAPVCHTLMGTGAFPANHPLSLGLIGLYGAPFANQMLQKNDLLIALGTRFSERSLPERAPLPKETKVLHLDIDPAEIDKKIPADYALSGHLKPMLSSLLPLVQKKKRVFSFPLPAAATVSEGFTAPAILQIINQETENQEMLFATDTGKHQLFAAQMLCIKKPRSFFTSGGLGAMGFGLGAAMGAAIATGKRVCLLSGDGSFCMAMAELSTLALQKLPIIIVLFDNGSLGLVKQYQEEEYAGRFSAVDFDRNIAFHKIAQEFGIQGMHCCNAASFRAAFAAALKESGPVLIHCTLADSNVRKGE